jgi:hypothetical protein
MLNPNLVLAAIVVLVLTGQATAVSLVLTGHSAEAGIAGFVSTTIAALLALLQNGRTHDAVEKLVSDRTGEGG